MRFHYKHLLPILKQQKKNALKFFYRFQQIGLKHLFQDQSLQSSGLISAAIAGIYIVYLFPINFLAGYGFFFERGEPLISLSGWWAFKASPWQWPLLQTSLLNYPQGVNIAFTNSIPLLAILFKPFQYWLPATFHYFGIWFIVSYILQAVSATFLIRTLGQRTLLATIAAAFMALMMPAFLFQMEHIALLAQGHILLALTLYFEGVKNSRHFKNTIFYFNLLIPLAFLTHPYLFMMVALIYLAFLTDRYIQARQELRRCSIAFATTVSIILFIIIAGGYFNQNIRTAGYNYYSMNLLAPFYGGKLGYSFVNATGGQQRGFNYLGMGVVSALAFSVVTRWQWMIKIIKQYRVLVIALLLLVIFAISNHIFYGTKPVLHYGLIHPFKLLTEVFPSSGRMFWPVGYTLMFIGLLGVLRFENKPISAAIIMVILSVQFYDTQPLRRNIRNIAQKPSSIHSSWHRLVRSISAIQVYPAYGCVNAYISKKAMMRNHIIFLQGLAARYGKPINTACLARVHTPNCASKHSPFNKKLVRGQLYVVSPEARQIPYHISQANEYGWCKKSNHGILCVPYTNDRWWKTRTPPAPRPTRINRKRAHPKQKVWFKNLSNKFL